jgi:hypothetical protein
MLYLAVWRSLCVPDDRGVAQVPADRVALDGALL